MGEFVSAGGHEQADGLSARRMAPEVGFESTISLRRINSQMILQPSSALTGLERLLASESG